MKLSENPSSVRQIGSEGKINSSSSILSIEFRLLLLCSRVELNGRCQTSILRLIQEGVDWEEVVLLARMQGLAPLLNKSLSAIEFKGVPSGIQDRLKSLSDAFRLKNLMMVSELIKLVRAFKRNGIAVVPYKGPALAAALYHDVSLRQFSDLDLLVKPEDALRARRLVIDMGYASNEKISSLMERIYVQSDCEFTFKHDMQFTLEINWRIAPRYWSWPEIPKAIWNESNQLALASAHVPWMSPEDLLLLLCLHGTKHRWDELKWIVDVAELIRNYPELDLIQMLEAARKMSIERMLVISLLLAHDLLDASIPDEVLDVIRNKSGASQLAEKISLNLQSIAKKPPTILHMLSFLARASESFRMKSFCYGFLPIYSLWRWWS